MYYTRLVVEKSLIPQKVMASRMNSSSSSSSSAVAASNDAARDPFTPSSNTYRNSTKETSSSSQEAVKQVAKDTGVNSDLDKEKADEAPLSH